MKTITRRYFEETGLSAYKFNWLGRRIHNQNYVDWLEKQCAINGVSNSKADEREQAYQKYFRDDPQFRGRCYRLRDNYIWHKDEAYECIDYYLRTGIEP